MNDKETGLATIKPFDIKKEELQQLADDSKNQLVTELTLKAADSTRKILKKQRTDIQGLADDNKKVRLDWKRSEDAREQNLADELIKIIQPIELRLEKEINAITEKQRIAAAELIRKEEDRKRTIKGRIQILDNMVNEIRVMNKEDLEEQKEILPMEKDSFEEFNEEGNRVIDVLIQAISNREIFLIEEAKVKLIDEQNKEARLEAECKFIENELKPKATDSAIGTSPLNKIGNVGLKSSLDDRIEQGFNEAVLGETTPRETIPHVKETGNLPPTKHIPKITEINNIISIHGYTFGFSNKVPFDKIMEIKEYIEKILA